MQMQGWLDSSQTSLFPFRTASCEAIAFALLRLSQRFLEGYIKILHLVLDISHLIYLVIAQSHHLAAILLPENLGFSRSQRRRHLRLVAHSRPWLGPGRCPGVSS
jgi:hypothetical protein